MTTAVSTRDKIAIIGLGYVGLPVALAFAKNGFSVLGFDLSQQRVASLSQGIDYNDDVPPAELASATLKFTADPKELKGCQYYIVAVPTPIDFDKRPDLSALASACEIVGRVLEQGAIVIFESTVYPGVTEDICGPILENTSSLRCGVDFKLAYSPERINPGDTEHRLDNIIKVVSAQDEQALELVSQLYQSIVTAGVHRAPSIKVAEAAKVIENTQRDLNIALMNELAIIFDRLGISTRDVLAAAGTKWNFLRFVPGLVGGHCIGVDPYYLTTKAEQLGYRPQVILAGRRINDGMGRFIAEKTVKLLANKGCTLKGAKVGILGLTFKENVGDIRNSQVPSIASELNSFGVDTAICDPIANADAAKEHYGIQLTALDSLRDLDALVFAVNHRQFAHFSAAIFAQMLKPNGVIVDVKGVLEDNQIPAKISYWNL